MFSLESKLKLAAPVDALRGLQVPSAVPFCCRSVAQLNVPLLARLRRVKDGPVSDFSGDPGVEEPGAISYWRFQLSTRHARPGDVDAHVEASTAGPTEVMMRRLGRDPVVLLGMQ